LAAIADSGVQLATGTLVVLLVEQLVCVQELPPLADWLLHVATGTLLVLFVPQTVAVQLLPELAATLVQLLTPVGPVVIGAGQVVAT
jgi:putative effector of murein hydrolase LrgA (UPF0299 family)